MLGYDLGSQPTGSVVLSHYVAEPDRPVFSGEVGHQCVREFGARTPYRRIDRGVKPATSVVPALSPAFGWPIVVKLAAAQVRRGLRHYGPFMDHATSSSPPSAILPDHGGAQQQLRLWDGQDPNIHKLGVYPFDIDAKDLTRAVEAVKISGKAAPMLAIEVSKASLRIQSQTKDGLLLATSTVALPVPAEVGEAPVTFEVSADGMYAWVAIKRDARLACTYDANTQTLTMDVGRGQSVRQMYAKSRAPFQCAEEGVALGQVLGQPLAAGIAFASLFLPRQSSQFLNLDGVGLERGAVRGGYPKAVCRYRSSNLPEMLKLTISKEMSKNIRSLLRRLRGQVQVMDAGERIVARGHELEVSWTKRGFWPTAADAKMFDRPCLRSYRVNSDEFVRDLRFNAIFGDNLRLRFEHVGDAGWVTILAHGKIGGGHSRVRATPTDEAAAPATPWDVTFNGKDLVAAASAMPAAMTEVRLLEGSLVFAAADPEFDASIMLNGVEAR